MQSIFSLTFLLCLITLYGDFVTVKKDDKGIWWLYHNGQPFVTRGVNHVNNGGQDDGVGGRESSECKSMTGNPLCGDTLSFGQVLKFAPYYNTTQARYNNSEQSWATNSITRLQNWGFNSIGGWSATVVEKTGSSKGMYYAHLLDMGTTWLNHNGLDWDVWSDNFTNQANTIADAQVTPRVNDEWLLGWQLDNEIDWSQVGLNTYLRYLSPAPGLQKAIDWLTQQYTIIDNLNQAWNITATSFNDVPNHLDDTGLNKDTFNTDSNNFVGVVAEQYFHVCHDTITSRDPNHLILGVRFYSLPDPVLKALIPYVDVVDQHGYGDYPPDNLAYIYNVTGHPVFVGEFSFTAIDSNMPNTVGARAYNPYTTQSERAAAFTRYVKALVVQPYVLGYHWWQWADEPSSGRWPDGENSNYGLVHIDDDAYSLLTIEMTNTNAMVEQWHAAGSPHSKQPAVQCWKG